MRPKLTAYVFRMKGRIDSGKLTGTLDQIVTGKYKTPLRMWHKFLKSRLDNRENAFKIMYYREKELEPILIQNVLKRRR